VTFWSNKEGHFYCDIAWKRGGARGKPWRGRSHADRQDATEAFTLALASFVASMNHTGAGTPDPWLSEKTHE
jgi:hypothetical protein